MFKLKLPWKGKKKPEQPPPLKTEEAKIDFDRIIYEKTVSLRTEYRILESYPLVDPWARALILERKSDGSQLYFVDEIPLTSEERDLYNKVLDILYWELEPPPKDKDPREHFKEQVSKIIKKFRLRFSSSIHPGISWQKIEYYINRDSIEYGPITPLMKDPAIEDISCDGVGRPIYVWHTRYESIPTNIIFDNDEELDDLVVKLAHKAGKHVSVAFPIIDAILPEGHRLAATYKREVSRDGSTFTIRKFREKPLSIINLVLGGTVSSLQAAYFWKLLEYNMTGLIMGVTGAGKTTLLNALATLLRPTIKIVTIEDTPELRLTHENWVQLYSRPSYGFEGGMGEISLYDLVRVSLRYRPDVVIVGEVRGEEAKVLFQAIASVSWDTPILIKDKDGKVKLVNIGEFVDQFYNDPREERVAKEVEDHYVLSHDGYKTVWKPIKYVLRHRTSKIYQIKTETGAVIKATGNHSVFVIDPETLEIREKRVDQLKQGDLLLTFIGSQQEKELSEKTINVSSGSGRLLYQLEAQTQESKLDPVLGALDEDLAFIMGLYIAYGCVKHYRGSRICFTLGNNEKRFAGRMLKIMKEKYGLKPTITRRETYTMYEYNNSLLARKFEKLMGRKLDEKHVPETLWSADSSIVKAFFEGLRADSQRTLKSRYINYVTANRQLAVELVWLARMHGWQASLYKEKGSGKYSDRTYYNVNIYFNNQLKKPAIMQKIPVKALLRLAKLANAKSMPYNLRYVRKRKYVGKKTAFKVLSWIRRKGILEGEALEQYNRIMKYFEGSVRPVKVKEIKVRDYDDYVYDISVPGTESFFGGTTPILLHNTGHGGITTIHAEHIDAAVKRLTSPPMDIPKGYIPLVNFAMAIKRVRIPIDTETSRVERRVTEVWEIRDYDNYVLVSRWDPASKSHQLMLEDSILLPRIAEMTGVNLTSILEDIEAREKIIKWMAYRRMTSYQEVGRIITEYYRRPYEVLKKAEAELPRYESYT